MTPHECLIENDRIIIALTLENAQRLNSTDPAVHEADGWIATAIADRHPHS